MLDNKNGFTLLELLIAAALIGVLAMFATQAYRASASDIRIEDAKARALLLVNAAERYYTEYPNASSFGTGSAEAPLPRFEAPGNTCTISNSSVQELVNCGFLEYRQVAYDSKDSTGALSSSVNMWFATITPGTATVEVCFKGKGRVTDSCTYCTANGADFSKSCPAEE